MGDNEILLLYLLYVNCNHWIIVNAWTSLDAKGRIRFKRKLIGVEEMAKNKPSQGARKTETLTLRLDPKVKMMIEMISRIRRQSITGVVEAAIEEIAFDLDAPFFYKNETNNWSLSSAITEVWSTDESERFINMCYHLPTLLTYEEQRIWETIKASKVFLATDATVMETFWEIEGIGRIDRSSVRIWWTYLLEHVDEHKDSRTIVPFEPPF
ncbi:hypothetical protein [Pseudomonas sp. AK181]|uniref:hypothetical protein n=1 Tax=Pseudomonas sp. AK181 TaxID=3097255 RepID=UPI003DA72055